MTRCYIQCPCGEEIPVPIEVEIVTNEDGNQSVIATPDASQLWLHSFAKHPDAHSENAPNPTHHHQQPPPCGIFCAQKQGEP